MEFLETLIIILFSNILLLHVATALLDGSLRYVSAVGTVFLHLLLMISQLVAAEPLINVAISIMISLNVYAGADFISCKWIRPHLYKSGKGDKPE